MGIWMEIRKSLLIQFCFVASFFLMLVSPCAGQDTEETEASGMGSIIAGDIAHARDDAIKDAKRNAVEQVVKVLVSAETEVQNAMVVMDKIRTNAGGYIRKYQVIKESKGADGVTYEVTIKALVERGNIKDDIGEILHKKGNPRVMVMVEERNIGETHWLWSVDLSVAEAAIIEKFRQKGFQVVDKAQFAKNVNRQVLENAIEGDAKAALAVATKYGAEVLVVGKAFAKAASGAEGLLGGMHSVQATVQARAFNADNARILVSKTETAPAVHIDEITGGTKAIEAAANKITDYMIGQILKGWASTGTNVTFHVRGLTAYNDLSDFENTLKFEIRGVDEVNQRDFSGGQAELDVQTWRNASDLARELTAKSLEKFRVNVTSQTANVISLRVSKK